MKDKNKTFPIEGKIIQFLKSISADNRNGKTVLSIFKEGNKDSFKKLSLEKGCWEDSTPWVIVDEHGKTNVFISVENLNELIGKMQSIEHENFNLKLEKTIFKNIPIDFQDVWVVAMNKIKSMLNNSSNKNPLSIDIDELVGKIKSEHPNLFLDVNKLHI